MVLSGFGIFCFTPILEINNTKCVTDKIALCVLAIVVAEQMETAANRLISMPLRHILLSPFVSLCWSQVLELSLLNVLFHNEIVQIDAFSLEMDSLPPEGKELQLKVWLTSKRTSHRDSYLNASSHKRKSTSTIGTCSCVSFPSVENEYKFITKKESHDAVNIISNQNQSLRGQVMALPDNCELKSNEGNTYPQHGKLIVKDKQSLERCSDEDKREKSASLLENEFVSNRNRMNSMRKVVMQGAQNLNGNVERGISLKIKEVTSVSGEKQPPIARTALAEKTNVCIAEETTALHAPGKWKCPRKSKPHVGPPLKQLRLERWVRRVL